MPYSAAHTEWAHLPTHQVQNQYLFIIPFFFFQWTSPRKLKSNPQILRRRFHSKSRSEKRRRATESQFPKGQGKANFSFFPSFLIPSDQCQREQIRSRCRNCGRLTGVSSPSPRCTRRGRGVRRQLHPIGVGSRGADNFGPRSHLGATGRCACRGLPRPLDPGNAARRLAPRARPLPAPCQPPRLHR